MVQLSAPYLVEATYFLKSWPKTHEAKNAGLNVVDCWRTREQLIQRQLCAWTARM